jgi:hypothetical protein
VESLFADVAQLAEQLICNQQVASSILAVSSLPIESGAWLAPGSGGCFLRDLVGYPSGQREQTVNLPAYAFEGSNPSPTMGIVGVDFLFVLSRE